MTKPLPFPQADDLAKVRELVAAVARGASKTQAGQSAKLSVRHTDYYANAAMSLGLLGRDGCITTTGSALVASVPRSPQEAALLRTAIESCAAVASVAPQLLNVDSVTNTPTALERSLAFAVPGLSAATVARRRSALLAWRAFVLEREANPVLPFALPNIAYNEHLTLDALCIESFKAFGAGGKTGTAVAPIDISPLTVFAGANGVGKTTILQALDVLGALTRVGTAEMLREHNWEYDDLPHLRAINRQMTITATLAAGNGSRVRWKLVLGARRYAGIHSELLQCQAPGGDWQLRFERDGRAVKFVDEDTQVTEKQKLTLSKSWISTRDASDPEERKKYPTLLALKAWAEGIVPFWSLQPSTLRTASRTEKIARIGPLGEDLSAFLHNLSKQAPDRFQEFLKRVKTYYPRLVDIKPKSVHGGWKHLEITESWQGQEATFNARQVSDGLLRILVIASIPDWSQPPTLVLLDEVENGLHPRLIGSIVGLLQEISKRTQVLATTHSPITLNYVPEQCTQIVTRGPDGGLRVTPLRASRNFEKLREHFEPGELWYNVGEDSLVSNS